MRYPLLLSLPAFTLLGCTDFSGSPAGKYATYDCAQLWREKSALNEEIQTAHEEQSTHAMLQLAKTALALSNGDSYNAQPETDKTDHLKAQLDEVKHEAIRKQCNL